MQIRVIHECCGEATEMFYCSAVSDRIPIDEEGEPPEPHTIGLDWYAHEQGYPPENKHDVVSAITYCPFCGIKLAETLEAANLYTFEDIEDEDREGDE